MKGVDLGEPTPFLDHVYLGCTQRECQTSNDIVHNRISARATEKLPETKATGKPDAETISSWSYDMEGHAKNSGIKQLSNYTKSQRLAWMIINSEEENGSVEEWSTVCSQIVLKCPYVALVGRPDILWSVNKLARAVTKSTRACDKRLARLISYIHHT